MAPVFYQPMCGIKCRLEDILVVYSIRYLYCGDGYGVYFLISIAGTRRSGPHQRKLYLKNRKADNRRKDIVCLPA